MAWRTIAVVFFSVAVPLLADRPPGLTDIGGPFSYEPVVGVPFTADAATTARLTFQDGSQVNQRTTARYFRNSAGDGRVELRFENARAPQTAPERHIRITLEKKDDQGRLVGLSLDPSTRSVRGTFPNWVAFAAGGMSPEHAALDSMASERRAGLTFAGPLGPLPGMPVRFLMLRRAQDMIVETDRGQPIGIDVRDEPLGRRTIAGIDTIGRRVTLTVPPGALGNDAPYQLVDERWESPELRLLVAAQMKDSRTGTVDYELSNISRSEPAASLFDVPADYTWEAGAPYINTVLNGVKNEGAWITLVYPDPLPRIGMMLGGYATQPPAVLRTTSDVR
jgi:hypothetical protein